MSDVRHDPMYLRGGGARWAVCSCGWASLMWRTQTGAQLAHGRHLLEIKAVKREPADD